jgi:hypothetical protein
MNQLWNDSENIHLKANEYSSEVVKSYENKLTKTKKQSKLSGVEKFSENKNEE